MPACLRCGHADALDPSLPSPIDLISISIKPLQYWHIHSANQIFWPAVTMKVLTKEEEQAHYKYEAPMHVMLLLLKLH